MLEDSARLPVDSIVKQQLDSLLGELEAQFNADVITIFGPILYGVDDQLRRAVETIRPSSRTKVAVVLDTLGGLVEVVERMVDVIRHHYDEVIFIIPDRAMSAGTVFAMSGDTILMDHFSRLGPIDPQIQKDGKLVPALSYLVQYRRLIHRARKGVLSDAEFALLARFDLAEIHQYEQARNLTKTLLRKWLATFKFKNWFVTETQGRNVDDALRRQRAEEIADILSDNLKWHSHARGISMNTLRSDDVKLKIDDFSENPDRNRIIRSYYGLLRDYLNRQRFDVFMHTRNFF